MWSNTLLRSYSNDLSELREQGVPMKTDRNEFSHKYDLCCTRVKVLKARKVSENVFFQPDTPLSFPAGHIHCRAYSSSIFSGWSTVSIHFSQWSFMYREMMGLERSFISHNFQGGVFTVGNTKSMFPPQGLSAVTQGIQWMQWWELD